MGRKADRQSAGLSAASGLTADEALEMDRLERRCYELELHKGITDTVHHDRLRELRQKANRAAHTDTLKEEYSDGTDT